MLDRGRHEQGMRGLLLDITYRKASNTAGMTSEPDSIVAEFFSEMINTGIAPCQIGRRRSDCHIRTKQIFPSWDLRDDAHGQGIDPASLPSLLHERQHKSGLWTVAAENEPPYYFYHLRDEQRSAGEVGCANEARWVMATRMYYSHLVSGKYTTWEYAHIEGPGEDMCKRLKALGRSSPRRKRRTLLK
jgi:hypothetical protein